jgi:hypothetical protein
MPRPCAVEFHARGNKESRRIIGDATALRRGVSRSRLQRKPRNYRRCHGLVPWSFTLAATKKAAELSEMPRPCAVEFHAWTLLIIAARVSAENVSPPWHKAVASAKPRLSYSVAASVNLHGARPWHHSPKPLLVVRYRGLTESLFGQSHRLAFRRC